MAARRSGSSFRFVLTTLDRQGASTRFDPISLGALPSRLWQRFRRCRAGSAFIIISIPRGGNDGLSIKNVFRALGFSGQRNLLLVRFRVDPLSSPAPFSEVRS